MWRDASAWRQRPARAGLPGIDGAPADPVEIRELVDAGIARARSEIRDGRDADPAAVATMVVAAIASTMRAGDAPSPRLPWRLIPYRDENTDLIQYIDLIPL